MRVVVVVLTTALLSVSCIPPPVENIPPTLPFDPQQAQHIFESGSGTIKGQAFLRQRGGGIVTCAGYEVILTPSSEYAAASFRFRYGYPVTMDAVAYRSFKGKGNLPHFEPHAPGYVEYKRRTRCDAEGRFEFVDVAEGAYYIEAIVRWEVPMQYYTSIQGGGLATLVSIGGEESRDLILTP